jgi:predicted RNA-binding Zn-ribbon protein involved in translation (DUF1610 family)
MDLAPSSRLRFDMRAVVEVLLMVGAVFVLFLAVVAVVAIRVTRKLCRSLAASAALGSGSSWSPHLRALIEMQHVAHSCPKCSSSLIARAYPQRTVEDMLRVLGWHVYRCLNCGHYFYDRRSRR